LVQRRSAAAAPLGLETLGSPIPGVPLRSTPGYMLEPLRGRVRGASVTDKVAASPGGLASTIAPKRRNIPATPQATIAHGHPSLKSRLRHQKYPNIGIQRGIRSKQCGFSAKTSRHLHLTQRRRESMPRRQHRMLQEMEPLRRQRSMMRHQSQRIRVEPRGSVIPGDGCRVVVSEVARNRFDAALNGCDAAFGRGNVAPSLEKAALDSDDAASSSAMPHRIWRCREILIRCGIAELRSGVGWERRRSGKARRTFDASQENLYSRKSRDISACCGIGPLRRCTASGEAAPLRSVAAL